MCIRDSYIGEPWRTQKRVRTLLDEWFRNDLMGLPGDEDGGGMSAFVAVSYTHLPEVTVLDGCIYIVGFVSGTGEITQMGKIFQIGRASCRERV